MALAVDDQRRQAQGGDHEAADPQHLACAARQIDARHQEPCSGRSNSHDRGHGEHWHAGSHGTSKP